MYCVSSDSAQEQRDRRKQEQLDRKQEAKLLLEQEEEKLGVSVRSAPPKVTRAEISALEERKQKESEEACALPTGVVLGPSLERNPNHLLRESLEKGELEARTVEEAIDVLSVSTDQPDRHPERRLKAAYAAFEERELPRLKAENSNLRESQVKQLLRKEWKKSPDNPMNQY